MKKISAALFLTAALSLGVSAYAQTTNPTGQVDPPSGQTGNQKPAELKDVPAGHWASAAIQVAADCGIVRGFPDGTFRGNEPITRYQAAVIIARLLDAIKNGECGLPGSGNANSLSNADLEALQNAIQELSADLAQLGVRVAELEDNAVTQDDLARVEEIATQARDLAEQAAAGTGGVSPDDLARVEEIANEARDLAEALANASGIDPEAVNNLADQVEAASIAADTALAQARELQDKVDELSGRVDDLEAQLGELGATVEGQADSIAALNDLVVLLNQDVLSLQDRVTQLERQVADSATALDEATATFASQEDLESLREFTTLLRRDQTALADRVGELEGRVGALENRVAGVEGRVTVLENNGFTVSGTLGLNYYRGTTWDNAGGGTAFNFDVDRLFFGSPFSTGAYTDGDFTGAGYVSTSRDFGDFRPAGLNDVYDFGTFAGFGTALTPFIVDANNKTAPGNGVRIEGAFDPSISLNFTFKPRALVGSTTNGVGNSFSVSLTLSLTTSGSYGNPSDGSDTVDPVGLKLTSLATKYTIGGAPLLINFGINPGFKFTNYGFNNGGGRGDGFVATLDGSSILPLNLALTIVYGSKSGLDAVGDANQFVYFTGVRGTASLIPGITGGIYYAVEAPDVVTPNQGALTTNLFGLDFAGALGPIKFDGEYNVSVTAAPGQVAGYARASADFGIFTIGGNYRVVDNAFNGLGDGGPYDTNQRGFGADIALKLGFATLGFYYDQRNSQDPNFVVGDGPKDITDGGAAVRGETDFGLTLSLRLIGFDIAPYFNRENEFNGSNAAVYDRTRYGVNLTHDGTKPDALIGGLNLALGYRVELNGVAPGGDQTTLFVYGDATINLLGFAITPKGYFSQVTTSSTTFRANDDVTNFGGGLAVKGGFLFGSTLSLAGAIDQSSHSGGPSGNFTSSTTWATVALSFNPSIFGTPSTFSIAYATRLDVNRNGKGSGPSLASPVGDRSWAGTNSGGITNGFAGSNAGDILGVSTNLNGLYFTFSYYGLDFAYGIFSLVDFRFANNAIGGVTFGQAFRIGYTLKF